MAKSFIDVVQDSPRTVVSISVETKKPPLTNQYTAAEPPFGFKLCGQLVPALSRVRLFRHPFARDFHPWAHVR